MKKKNIFVLGKMVQYMLKKACILLKVDRVCQN